MLALDAPADTLSYMVAGYIIIFGVMALFLISLAIRRRNLKQDLDTLEELEDKEKKPFVPQGSTHTKITDIK